MSDRKYTPVVILGAGRSGTNILRDCLTALPDLATWPCDEIQPIWRYKNGSFSTDELPADAARDDVKKFINRAFDAIWKKYNKPRFVVEKTCANTLRVPFIEAVLDEPIYIHLVRHGSKVVPSAVKRWRGELEVPGFAYFAAKARYIPIADVPSYLISFISKRIGKLLGREQALSSWGPRFAGIDTLSRENLDILCAKQWAACVTRTQEGLADVPQDRKILIFYEDFISNPHKEMSKILTCLNIGYEDDVITKSVDSVRQKQTDKDGEQISSPEVRNILLPVLEQLKYGVKP